VRLTEGKDSLDRKFRPTQRVSCVALGGRCPIAAAERVRRRGGKIAWRVVVAAYAGNRAAIVRQGDRRLLAGHLAAAHFFQPIAYTPINECGRLSTTHVSRVALGGRCPIAAAEHVRRRSGKIA